MTRRQEGRLLVDGPAPGAWNMAIDEALLEEAVAGRPTLRFYRWSQPTLSLGYFQTYAQRNDHLPSRRLAAVRRQTGGGALVHDRELTYSLCLPATLRWASDPQALYEVVHGAFRTALAEWSVDTCLVRDIGGDLVEPKALPFLCFLRRNPIDLVTPAAKMAAGVKVLGSAQRRRRGAVLQHGALLAGRSPAAPELPGLAEACGLDVQPTELVERLEALLSEQLEVAFVHEILSEALRERAEQLKQQKYESSRWTQRR